MRNNSLNDQQQIQYGWRYLNNHKLDPVTNDAQLYSPDRRYTSKGNRFNISTKSSSPSSSSSSLYSSVIYASIAPETYPVTYQRRTSPAPTQSSINSNKQRSKAISSHTTVLVALNESETSTLKINSASPNNDDLNRVYEYKNNLDANSHNYIKKNKTFTTSTSTTSSTVTISSITSSTTSAPPLNANGTKKSIDNNAESIVPILNEPHDYNWTNNVVDNTIGLPDVDTNLIDTGQRNALQNNSKLEEKNLVKNRNLIPQTLSKLSLISNTFQFTND